MEKKIKFCDNCKKEETEENPVRNYTIKQGFLDREGVSIDLCSKCVGKVDIKTILSRERSIKDLQE